MASIRPGKVVGTQEIRYYRDGKRYSETIHGTKRDAILRAAVLDAESGNRPGGAPATLGEAMGVWMAGGGNRHSPLSDKAVEGRVRNWVLPRIGNVPLERLTHQRLEAFYREIAPDLSHGSVKNIHYDIRGALNNAVRNGHLAKNPADLVKLRRTEEPREIVPPTPAMISTLLAWVDARDTMAWSELALAVRIAVTTGCRRGEVCGLRWGDIDTERARISILRNVVDLGAGKVQVRRTKTSVIRHIVVPPQVPEATVAHRERWLPHVPGPSEPLFLGTTGDHISPTTLSTRFTEARKQSGVHFRFHDLRHFAVSAWLTTMSLQEVSRAIGHRHMSTTANIYAHQLGDEIDRRPAETLGRLLPDL